MVLYGLNSLYQHGLYKKKISTEMLETQWILVFFEIDTTHLSSLPLGVFVSLDSLSAIFRHGMCVRLMSLLSCFIKYSGSLVEDPRVDTTYFGSVCDVRTRD